MNGTLTLKNPVMINGDKITEMKYDTNEIDGVLFATAEAKRKAAAGMKNLSVSAAAEFDFGLHPYLGYAAIVAVNPTYDFSDLERMKGADVVEVMALGQMCIRDRFVQPSLDDARKFSRLRIAPMIRRCV